MKIKGSGSIRQVKTKDGKPVKNSWQLILSLGTDPVTGKRKQKCRHFFGNKTEARAALADFKREMEQGLKFNAEKILFGDYAQSWFDERQASGTLAPSTIERNRQILAILLPYLQDVRLIDIDATTLRNLYIKLTKDGVGQASAVKAATVINQVLKQALNDNIILSNPCDRVKAPKPQKSKVAVALDKTGIAKLTAALDKEESKVYPNAKIQQPRHNADVSHITAIRLAIASGMRRGEILALSWEDIDFSSCTVTVNHTLCTVTNELKIPKTETSIRTISLDKQMIDKLINWKRMQALYLLSLGIVQNGKTPVVSNEVGERIDGSNLTRWWHSFQKQYGFEGLRIHDLRHCHATALVSSGLNIKAISSRLGHASVSTTLDLYSHAQRKDDEHAANIIGEIMCSPVPSQGRVVNF